MRQEDVKRFYAEHGDELRRYLTRRLDSAQIAADLTQETFARLMKASPAEEIDNPRAYLFRIASNLAADHFRSEGFSARVDEPAEWDRLPDDAPGPERTVLAREEVRRLEQAVDKLPPRQREILLMHKFQGLTYTEIASRLGISKNTVMVHMMRALAHCRDHLAEE